MVLLSLILRTPILTVLTFTLKLIKKTILEKRDPQKITEKQIVTFNPKLAKKQIYEINKEVEKAKRI